MYFAYREECVFHLIIECMGYKRERNAIKNIVKAVLGMISLQGDMCMNIRICASCLVFVIVAVEFWRI